METPGFQNPSVIFWGILKGGISDVLRKKQIAKVVFNIHLSPSEVLQKFSLE